MTGVKKNLTTLGTISIRNDHSFSKGNNGFQISSLMQELMVFAGTTDCYGKCNEIIGKFLSIEVSAAQVYRVTEAYGAELSQTMDATQRTLPPARDDETVYIEADGAMVLTRDEGWMKLSGQRWSITGAQHMLQLRTTYMNKQWHKIILMSKTDFKNKAA